MQPTPSADDVSVTLEAAVHHQFPRYQLDIQSGGHRCHGNSSMSRTALNHIGRSDHNRPTSRILNQ